jgi:hypothetical protein
MTDDSQKAKPPQSAEELLQRYREGERGFIGAGLPSAPLRKMLESTYDRAVRSEYDYRELTLLFVALTSAKTVASLTSSGAPSK